MDVKLTCVNKICSFVLLRLLPSSFDLTLFSPLQHKCCRDKKTKPKGPKPANKTPPKARKPNDSTQTTAAKTTRGKRGGGKRNNNIESGDNISEENAVAAAAAAAAKTTNNTSANSGKKKRNKKRDSQGGNDDGDKKTPNLKDSKQFNSEHHNAKNYAWSAFQSSPDPSALPDIGGLFLGGSSGNDESKESGAAEKNEDDVGSSSTNLDSSLNFGPPSDRIRGSLVNSMLAKTDGGVNAGEALLKSLTSPSRQSFSNPMPAVHEQFRTAESLEAEMLSPSLKPEEKTEAEQSTLHQLDLTEGAAEEKSGTEKAINEEKRDDTERANETAVPQTKSVSPNPAEQSPQPPMKKEYPDAITQLMNPGFGGGGYGMHPPMHHPQHAPYHYPLHHGPPPPGPYHGHHAPLYPMPHHPHHPYHPMHHRPGFTTIQVRVPQSLLPGNMMIVEGMQIQVPPGVPPGAIIPVNIPIPNPQHYYGHPPHHPPNFPGGFSPHPMHPGQHPMMHQHHQLPPPPPPSQPQQHQNQAAGGAPESESWAAKAARGPAQEADKARKKDDKLKEHNTESKEN
jgi:hypothetical protein